MKTHSSFWSSIRWRAAVLTSTLVAVVLTALIWYAFARMSRDLVAGGTERAQTAASVLAAQTGQTSQQGLVRLQNIAQDPALRDYLGTANDATARAAVSALQRADLPGQEGRIELWDADGRLRLTVGLPERTAVRFPPDSRPAGPSLMPLVPLGGEVFSQAIVEVPGHRSEPRLGLIVVTRLIRSPTSSALLRNVVGNGASVLIGNQNQGADASATWTDLESTVRAPQIDVRHPASGEFRSGTGEREIGAWAQIPGTPWLLLVEFPRRIIVAPAWQLLQRLIAVGLAFLVLATFAATRLSRRVTQPLTELTLAVQALEQGEYGRRVLASGRDEVGQLSHAFNAMAQQIESGRQAKDDFLAVLSHELRTPLSAVLGWCHLLRSGTLPPEERDHAIEVIERNALSQLHLVNDLLDVSRIVVGKFAVDLQPSDPVAVVRASVESSQPAAERRDISLTLNIDMPNRAPATVLLDADRLRQAVDNLVSNALKFTPRGGAVHISAGRRQGCFEIAVRDDGEGIAPDALPKVFDRFRQGEPGSQRRHAGLGLGLAIARQIVEIHHGTITADSAGVGRGSTFRIQLPLHEASTDPTKVPHIPAPLPEHVVHQPIRRVAGLRVLVIEDADDSRDFLREVLTHAGAIVAAAPRAAVAIEWLHGHQVDAIVSDIEMPDQDGLAMMRAIRASVTPAMRVIPAIALSAYAGPEDRARSLAAGYQIHLTKPVVVDELLSTLALVTGHSPSELRASSMPSSAEARV